MRPVLGVKFDPSLAVSLGHYMHESHQHFQTYVSARGQLASYRPGPVSKQFYVSKRVTSSSFETYFETKFRNQVSKQLPQSSSIPKENSHSITVQRFSSPCNQGPFVSFWNVPTDVISSIIPMGQDGKRLVLSFSYTTGRKRID